MDLQWAADGHPAFFAQAPRIRVQDPLAAFLGAASGGVLEYGYVDVVKLAGHSCPTVASAFLMTRAALAALYGEALPQRGAVHVAMREPVEEGVTGVIANVVALLTGVTVDSGFKGLGGRFDRRRLLAFGAEVPGQMRFTRTDTGAAVDVAAQLAHVPGDPRMPQLMPLCVARRASAEQEALFQALWQERVRRLLVEHADDPRVIVVSRV